MSEPLRVPVLAGWPELVIPPEMQTCPKCGARRSAQVQECIDWDGGVERRVTITFYCAGPAEHDWTVAWVPPDGKPYIETGKPWTGPFQWFMSGKGGSLIPPTIADGASQQFPYRRGL